MRSHFIFILVSLELLRQESSLDSARTSFQHFKTAELAQSEFQKQSLQSRSKFDREAGKFRRDRTR